MPNFNVEELRENVVVLHNKNNTEQAITATTHAVEGLIANKNQEPDQPAKVPARKNALELSSLLGYAGDLELEIKEQQPFLGQMAVTGEATIWYAAPNTGKTLLAIHLIMEAVERGTIEPSKIFYIAADDSANGLVEKLRILEEYGVHVLAPGHRGFETSRFVATITKMTADDDVNGLCIIADTVKKFTDPMDKKSSREFGNTVRRFVMKGGSYVGLAHTNKKRDASGQVVYAGTTDLLEDFDCAYLVDEVEQTDGRKTIAFKNIKKRGNVAGSAAYSYSIEEGMSFGTLLASVVKVGDEELAHLYRQVDARSDASLITAIERHIAEGTNSKMLLAKAVSVSEHVSRHKVTAVIERYTGDDPAIHKWTFSTGGHNKRVYVPLG